MGLYHADEWKNFLERVDCRSEEELRRHEDLEEELRLWASYRGQTLTRTGIDLLFENLPVFWIWEWFFYFYFVYFPYNFNKKVRGMMYYRKALELQAFLDMAKEEGTHRKLGDKLYLPHYLSSTLAVFNCWFFLRSKKRVQGCWIKFWRTLQEWWFIVVSMSSSSWYEVYICRVMPAIWNW